MKKLLPLLLLTLTPAWAHPPVNSPSLTFLPPEGQVVDMLTQDPIVRRAGALLNAAPPSYVPLSPAPDCGRVNAELPPP